MAAPNLDKMSVKELKELIAKAQATLAKKDKEERKRALAEAREAALKRGYRLEDLLSEGGQTSAKAKGNRKPKPRFRHPDDPDLTWSGLGRKPRWVVDAEQAGKLDHLRIAD